MGTRTTIVTPAHILTIWEPYATLIAEGIKTQEFRSWRPPRSLPFTLAIHAGKTMSATRRKNLGREVAAVFDQFGFEEQSSSYVDELVNQALDSLGKIVAVADVVMIADRGGTTLGWCLHNVRKLVVPLAWRGTQGLGNFNTPLEVR